MAENKKITIYADLLPDEYFLIQPKELQTDDDYIKCPVCLQKQLFNAGTLKLRGKEYSIFNCDNCGELYYGELLSTGALKLRFYSDTEILDPNKDLQNQFTQYLINHKSVAAYAPQKSAFKSQVDAEEEIAELGESNMNNKYSIQKDRASKQYIVFDTQNKTTMGMFESKPEAESYAASLMAPIEEDAFDKEIIGMTELEDRVQKFQKLTGIAVIPLDESKGMYEVAGDVQKGDLKDAVLKYKDTFKEPLWCTYDKAKDSYCVMFMK